MKKSKEKDKSVELFSFLIAFMVIIGICVCDHAAEISQAAASLMFSRCGYFTSEESGDNPKGSSASNNEQAEKGSGLAFTPKDILAAAEKFAELHKNDEKENDIRSVTYGEKGATDIFKNIKVKNNTQTKSLDIEKVLAEPFELSVDKSKPAVLIFHSHTSEGYELTERDWFAKGTTSRSNDESINVVRVGTEITNYLEKAGYTVIHDKTIHDDDYNGSYPHSRKTIDAILKENPQIKIVIDIHRDSITLDGGAKVKPVTEIGGKKAAQMMIIAGAEEGKITDFPDWEYNLRFALRLHQKIEDMYPGIMRPLLFTQKKYNMDVTHFSVLIEMGSEANTLDEACYSGRILADALASFMDEYAE